MAPQRNREWDEFSPQKKEEILFRLNEILGEGWEERICK
jgi:hypothetical protein